MRKLTLIILAMGMASCAKNPEPNTPSTTQTTGTDPNGTTYPGTMPPNMQTPPTMPGSATPNMPQQTPNMQQQQPGMPNMQQQPGMPQPGMQPGNTVPEVPRIPPSGVQEKGGGTGASPSSDSLRTPSASDDRDGGSVTGSGSSRNRRGSNRDAGR